MLPVGGTQAAFSAGRTCRHCSRPYSFVRTPSGSSRPRSMILLTICLVAAALVGFALLLFRRRA